MPAVSISKYVLLLAHDPQEMARFRASVASAKEAMTQYGLSPEQQETLLSRDSKRVSDAVAAENPPSGEGVAISMTANLVHPAQ